jgi:hypothetical protein
MGLLHLFIHVVPFLSELLIKTLSSGYVVDYEQYTLEFWNHVKGRMTHVI